MNGTFRSHPIEWEETVHADTGLLGLTTKHIYFAGSRKKFRVRYDRIQRWVRHHAGRPDRQAPDLPDRRLLNLQRQLACLRLLIIDELGFVPRSTTGAELLFEVFSQRYERGSILVTTNLPFDEWTDVFGSERLTGALLDRLTHHVHILEMNGESYRIKRSRENAPAQAPDELDNP